MVRFTLTILALVLPAVASPVGVVRPGQPERPSVFARKVERYRPHHGRHSTRIRYVKRVADKRTGDDTVILGNEALRALNGGDDPGTDVTAIEYGLKAKHVVDE
ncbi:hypothetical protein DFH07DRAFT_770085 [Mycena maculata]|uniref:Uncharacterized protein n=1 Tax=Mycena maculata TaxID=230809 RepID=A0AAD7JJ72_9AGAR|nr:hypothetical protein DFH07DRAFT_770085 [Mycena maculata]